MRRAWRGLLVWMAVTLLLWLGGGLGLRASGVLSLLLALIADEVTSVQGYLSRPKRGVFHLIFNVDLGAILLDLGVIDDSTDWDQIVALQKTPYEAFPKLRMVCVWIPEANLFVWPSLQEYQSELKLTVDIQLPPGCPLAKSCTYPEDGIYSGLEERHRNVTFFIEPGYPNFEFGLSVPKAFADSQIKAGGFGSACLESKEKEIYGQFRLVIGHFPLDLFPPYCPWPAPSVREFHKQLSALKLFQENRKTRLEQLGWKLVDLSEYSSGSFVANHKYMEIEIFDREQ